MHHDTELDATIEWGAAVEATLPTTRFLDNDPHLRPTAPAERSPAPRVWPGVVLGTVFDLDAQGQIWVQWPGAPRDTPAPARSLVPIAVGDVGRDAALQFIDGDPSQPLVVGLLQPVATAPDDRPEIMADGQRLVDSERLVFEARQEIMLRCGDASITLTRAGKVLIRGAYVLSRSSGVNRVKGGSVQIN